MFDDLLPSIPFLTISAQTGERRTVAPLHFRSSCRAQPPLMRFLTYAFGGRARMRRLGDKNLPEPIRNLNKFHRIIGQHGQVEPILADKLFEAGVEGRR
jgi:hypothetical protein